MILQIIFGLTHGSSSIWLQCLRQMIVKVLLINEDAIVHLVPTAAETTLFASLIHKKCITFDNVLLGTEHWMV